MSLIRRYENAKIMTKYDMEESIDLPYWNSKEEETHNTATKQAGIFIKRAIAEACRRKNDVWVNKYFKTRRGFCITGNLYSDPHFKDGDIIDSSTITGFIFKDGKMIAIGTYEEYDVDFGFDGFDPVILKSMYPDEAEMKKQFPFGLDAACEKEHGNATKAENEEAYLLVFTEFNNDSEERP